MQPLALGDPLLRERRGSTDARGSVSFEDLPGGTVRVMLDRAEGPEVVVPARGREEVTLELGSAVVRGRVVDLDGSPVPEALLWIAKRGLADHARVAGRADFEGRFEFRGLGADHLIAAFAEGFRPCAPLEASAGEEVTLRLSRDAASIVGMVTDVEGRPVPDARVRIGTEAPPFYLISPDAPEKLELFTNQPPVTVQTDEHGWYRSDSAISGSEVEVFVRAADHVGQVAKVRLQRGEPTRHDVTLERGSTVVGRIVSPSGRPVPGVPVRVQKPGLGEPGWLHASTRTARDGEYRLTGLPPGMQRLRAEGGEQGEATGELVLAAGETRRWDAVLGGGPVIAGRVVDGEGAPLGGMIVALQAEGSPRRQVETDADGAFHFSDCKDTGHLVTVSDPDNLLPIPLLAEDGVRPGTERVLTVDLPRITGWIEASVLGPDGLPVADARLRLMNRDHAAMVDAEPDTGSRFHVGPIPVGSYELRLVCHRFPSVDLGTVQLEAGQTLNLGLHQFAPGGWLQLDVQDADGRMPEKMSISLRDADGMEAALPGLVGGDFRTQALPVGDYRLTVWGPGIPVTRSRATIRPDQVTDAPLRLERGREITFLLRGASVEMAGGKPFVLATTLFEDGEGNVLADHSFIFDDLERLRFSQPFLPGRYRIRVDTETGYAGELEFEVGVGTPEQVEVWLEK